MFREGKSIFYIHPKTVLEVPRRNSQFHKYGLIQEWQNLRKYGTMQVDPS